MNIKIHVSLTPFLLMMQSMMQFSRQTCHGLMFGLTAFLLGHIRFVWWLHKPDPIFQSVKNLATVVINEQNITWDLQKAPL